MSRPRTRKVPTLSLHSGTLVAVDALHVKPTFGGHLEGSPQFHVRRIARQIALISPTSFM